MAPYVEKEIGGLALDYLIERLSWGKTLSQRVAQLHNLASGKFASFLPVDSPPIAEKNLKSGGVLEGKKSEAQFVIRISRYLMEDADNLVVFEDEAAKADDPILQKSSVRTVLFGSEVYHILLQSDAHEEKIVETIDWQRNAWHEIAFLTQFRSAGRHMARGDQFSDPDIEALAKGVHTIASSAYDGEGYVLWTARI